MLNLFHRRPVGRHAASRSRRRLRRWPRRVLIGTNIIVAVALLGSVSIYGYLRWRIDSIKVVVAPHIMRVIETPAVRKETKNGIPPENILLIGNETRPGPTGFGNSAVLTGSLSDVIMIVHLDPATGRASLLSIPRDLFVPMPAGSPVGAYQKIDAALNDGANGPDSLIAAITQDLGIPINHFVEPLPDANSSKAPKRLP